MIDFSTLQGLTIPEGVVSQIDDASGRVIWMLNVGGPIVLQVEKITSDTYAGETIYEDEEFILLDIYPRKSDGTVNVTYCGLTKTLTFNGTNAQQVYFGTFNGVSDGVSTPASGELTIEGDYSAVGTGSYASSSKTSTHCSCIIAVIDLGNVKKIPVSAFDSCMQIESVIIPNGVRIIDEGAFYSCSKLKNLKIPASVTGIGSYNNPSYLALNDRTFLLCTSLTNIDVDRSNQYYSAQYGILFNKDKSCLIAYPSASGSYTIPNGVTEIWINAFYEVRALTNITIPATVKKIKDGAFYNCTGLTSITVMATEPPVFDADSLAESGYDNLFYGSTCPITVPKGYGETYKSSPCWSQYADRIVEAS